MKHVLYITPGFAKNEHDTTCLTYFQNFLKEIQGTQQNTVFTILAFQYPFEKSEYQWTGITVHSLGGKNKHGLYSIKLIAMAIFKILKIHRKRKIDIIHSLWLKDCALVGQLMTYIIEIKHICTAMGHDVLTSHNKRFLKMLPLSKMRIVTVSEFQAEELSKNTGISSEVISWGVQPQNELKQSREIDIISVGFLNKNKNIELFIDTVFKLKSKFPEIKCQIIGTDFMNGKIQNMITYKGLSNNISLTGYLDNPTVLERMKNAKILMHTSNFESQGYVFDEALSCGMKIISRKVGTANRSDYWHIVKKNEDFYTYALDFLTKNTVNISIVKNNITHTQEEYVRLYYA